MKTYQIVIAAVLLLAVGFGAGFYTHRAMAVKRIQRVAQMRFSEGFENNFFRIIEPTDEQREQLSPIVAHYAGQIAAKNRESRLQQKALIDSMHAEVKPMLTPEQVERLERFSRRFRDFKKHPGKKGEKKYHPREKKAQ
ncbi:MAG: hypothetical protein KDC66_05840 [Phaeodactylibacter sp.]|nr:hypothetical protein [Phaeodactylibacter sp.]MCB9273114.1 hypothetical protein [Lewinellaceae bacterium]